MAGKFIASLSSALIKVEDAIISAILHKIHPGFCIAALDSSSIPETKNSKFSISDIWNGGFLWAVPKHRRSLEKRLNRKFGNPKYVYKPLVPKTNLLMCNICGHHHESHTICGHCWEKVKLETEEIQKAIDKEVKLDPIKHDIVVLYEGERESKSEQFWKGQRIVEMPKKRPQWFHPNLLQPTTEPLSDSKEIALKDLA